MIQTAYVVSGTLTDNRTVTLDEPLPLTPSRVRLVVEPLQVVDHRTYQDTMARIRERQRLRGHQPLTQEELDRSLEADRESWDH
ncbi:MAG TPA: hypothetical protein VFJ58_16815 [Armatimonadota bacterium]|nr:hypothetical protein [Armatimonadota bacterium]